MSTNTNGPTSTGSTLPTDVFEGLFPALVNVIVAVNSEEQESLTHKQAVAIATDILRRRVIAAKQVVENLPGGEMSISDQDEVINMLNALRDQKRRQLEDFAKDTVINDQISSEPTSKLVPMDES